MAYPLIAARVGPWPGRAEREPNVNAAVRVLIVDDDPLVRAGLAMVIGGSPDLIVVGEAVEGGHADVHQHHVWGVGVDSGGYFASVTGLAHHSQVG